MAQRAVDRKMSEQIDWCLNYQWSHWSSLPENAKHWAEMDWTEQEVFHLEWAGITEHWLRELGTWAREGLLTPGQSSRYDELTRLVRAQRPTLRAMLQEETALTPTAMDSPER